MHSVQSYLEGLSSPELKGVLWGWNDRSLSMTEEDVGRIVDILRSRNDLDLETAAAVEKRLEATQQESLCSKPPYFLR